MRAVGERRHDSAHRARQIASAQAARYAARFPGWRDSSASPCPRVIAGIRCGLTRDGCCTCGHFYRVLDHARIWITRAGERVLTAEPYTTAVDDAALRSLVDECARLGLCVTLDDDSPYWPGRTVLVMVTRRAHRLQTRDDDATVC